MSSSDEDDDGGWIVGESIHKFLPFFFLHEIYRDTCSCVLIYCVVCMQIAFSVKFIAMNRSVYNDIRMTFRSLS